MLHVYAWAAELLILSCHDIFVCQRIEDVTLAAGRYRDTMAENDAQKVYSRCHE